MVKKMNTIEKMIDELCPVGVEWKTLGEVGEFIRGKRFVKKDITSEGVPCIHYGEMYTHYKIWAKESKSYLEPTLAAKLRVARPGDVVIVAAGETVEDIGGGVAWLGESNVVIHDACFAFTHILNPKYVSYYLQTDLFRDQIKRYISSGKISSINAAGLSKAKIPIPPLAIQQEIVKILDTFTTLEAELEAELEARKKQYEYYRDELLTFGDDVEWKVLGDVGILIRGNGLQKKDFIEDGVGCIHYGQIYTYYGTYADKTKTFVSPELAKKLKKAQKGDVLISGVSENIEGVCKPLGWLGDEICISGDMFAFRHNQNTKFITYLLQSTNFKRYKERFAHGAKVIRVKQDKILDYKIPIPPLSEQERIVAILDKFDALVNDISVGLPAELNARRKQYEYYRNKLLTFKEFPSSGKEFNSPPLEGWQ
jgi:type I restriction enzyme S subunit